MACYCTCSVRQGYATFSQFLYVVLISSFVVNTVFGREPTSINRCLPLEGQYDNAWTRGCGCRYEDTGSIVSLFELQTNASKAGRPVTPRFQSHDNINWHFSFNPCTDFSMFQAEAKQHSDYKPCIKVAAARWTNESILICNGLGNQKEGFFQSHTLQELSNLTVSNLTLSFRNTTSMYGMQISLVCNRNISANKTTFNYLGKKTVPNLTYYFRLDSVCCCPDGCKSGYVPSKKGESKEIWYIVGIGVAILLFLLLLILVFYIVQRRKKTSYSAIAGENDPLIRNI